ncbi:hypothetical protein I6N98_15810 [Spongiibacter nanhainus]|uniref:Chemotaxis phosphatase CheX-like domain-containing protein n=1 Tax=Spongiibacter nanhainus TaxID=2794344 RepID=A0A7T4QZZ5_9GAMM|nr:hypothetical protein [Spongiibacter nanhainus]QQD17787.1 hypothetical protein I6N98_15810 [Spongiibacter nanhainus]
MSQLVKPTADAVEKMLEMLFGDGTEVASVDSASISASAAAKYVSDEDALVALCVCDAAFLAYSGAALSMMPKGGAEDMIADGDFSKTILENFYEVMNICSRLIMSDTSLHIRLDTTVVGDAVAEARSALSPSQSIAFKISIPKYGDGQLTFEF